MMRSSDDGDSGPSLPFSFLLSFLLCRIGFIQKYKDPYEGKTEHKKDGPMSQLHEADRGRALQPNMILVWGIGLPSPRRQNSK